MTTAVRVRAAQTSTEDNEKLPSFAAEGELFVDYGNITSPATMPTDTKISINTTSNIEQPQPQHHQTSPDTPVLAESATFSLQEIFETDDGILPLPDYAEQQNPLSPAGDEWFNGDGDLLAKEARNQGGTPPHSVYSANHKQYLPNGSNESYTNNNGMNDKMSNSSSFDSGPNTPTSCSGSQTTSLLGSVGSNNSCAPRSSGSNPKPLLYSAIGSLENPTAVSLGSLNRRQKTGKEFCRRKGGESTLIPPANLASNQRTSWPIAINDSSKSTNSGPAGLLNNRTTPPVSNREKSSKRYKNVGLENGEEHKEQQQNLESSLANGSMSAVVKAQKLSNLRSKKESASGTLDKSGKSKRVSYNREALQKKKPVEMFRPSCDAYTPRIEKKSIKYRAAEMRTPVQKMSTPMGTLQRPNFRDALRRVAMILHQHIAKIEQRFDAKGVGDEDHGLFKASMREIFSEDNYCTSTYTCTMVRIPMARPGMVYGLRKINTKPNIPSEGDIYEFAHQLFKSVQLSSECSIVCLIYVERLMEIAKVPLLACTWRPIFMCGLLLASKVWQDLSSWNIEFSNVYPQYSLEAINRLELHFLRNVKWDLYISSR
jgi:hypothetical protein